MINNLNNTLQGLINDLQTLINNINNLETSIQEVKTKIDTVLNKLDQVLNKLDTILNKLDRMDAKLQKKVELEMGDRDTNTGRTVKKYFLIASLQGEGGVNGTRVKKAFIIGHPDVPVTVTPTNITGVFNIDVDTSSLSSGVYQLYVEVEIDLPLPDGTTQTFKGRMIFNVWVW